MRKLNFFAVLLCLCSLSFAQQTLTVKDFRTQETGAIAGRYSFRHNADGVLKSYNDAGTLTASWTAETGVFSGTFSGSISGTNDTAFIVDQDNAGAAAEQWLRFNLGSTQATDAALKYRRMGSLNEFLFLSAHDNESSLANVYGNAFYAALFSASGSVSGANIYCDSTSGEFATNGHYVRTHHNHSGAPSANAGLEVERDVSTDARITWNESLDTWQAGLSGSEATIFTGTNGSSLTNLNGSNVASGTVADDYGGTGQSTYATGDMLYASAANTLAKLAGNGTATRKFLKQVSSVPSWDTLTEGDMPGGTDAEVFNSNADNTASDAVGFSTVRAGVAHNIFWRESLGYWVLRNDDDSAYEGLRASTIIADGSGLTNLDAGDIASGVLADDNGGTGQSTYALGDILYASATNTLSKLSGNTVNGRKFLTQTGTGAVSAAPGWNIIATSDMPGGADPAEFRIGSGYDEGFNDIILAFGNSASEDLYLLWSNPDIGNSRFELSHNLFVPSQIASPKFVSTGSITSGNNGEMFYDSTDLTWQAVAPTGEMGLRGSVYQNTADATEVSNSSAENNFNRTYALPADSVTVGKKLIIRASGKYSSDAVTPGNMTLKIKAGSVVLGNAGAVPLMVAGANQGWQIIDYVTCRTTGASGTVSSNLDASIDNGLISGVITKPGNGTVTVDTTAANTLQCSVQFSVADTDNKATLEDFSVEVVD